MIPMYNTVLFTDVYESQEQFINDYADNGLPTLVSTSSVGTLYYLLFARYGNNPIANMDINQFKAKIWATVYQYGPTWEKRLEVQATIRALTEDELIAGSKQILNHAFNPSVEPSTGSTEELDYINDQNTTNTKRSKLDAYALLMDLLETDVTEDFIKKFKYCFKQFVVPEETNIYVEDKGD